MPRKPHPNALSDEVRTFIVVHLATYHTPTQIAELVNERFDLKVDRRQVYNYNPEGQSGARKVAKRWTDLFHTTRQLHLDDISGIPIANRGMRLRQLNLHYGRTLDQRNIKLSLSILEQASKEAGNFHDAAAERKVSLTGKMSVEEIVDTEAMRQRVAAAIAGVIEGIQQAKTG